MAAQHARFTCFIKAPFLKDGFSAKVTLRKRFPIRQTLQRDGRVELADIFIEPISDNHGEHHHFVLTNLDWKGLYIVRDKYGKESLRAECSLWDLGNLFATRIISELQRFV